MRRVDSIFEALPSSTKIFNKNNFLPRRRLGQNFLLDLTVAREIVQCAGPVKGTTIFEIGPGFGSLTLAMLLEGASKIIAIEKDQYLVKALNSLLKGVDGHVTLIHGDALTTKFISLAPPPRKVIANLPYSIATPFLVRLLKMISEFSSLTCTFQREVADRITAEPGSPSYGRLSVLAQYTSTPQKVLDLHPQSFLPVPKVWSSVVHFIPKNHRLPVSIDVLELVTRVTFGQRRKMLSSSLRALHSKVPSLFQEANINKECRPEKLSVEAFIRLAGTVDKYKLLLKK